MAAVRLLLEAEQLPPEGNKLHVAANKRSRRVVFERSAEVLLADFVERFDRRRLPIAEVEVTLR